MEEENIVEEEIFTSDSDVTDFAKVIDLMLNDQYGRKKTVLTGKQATKLSIIETIGQLYDISFFKTWIPLYTEYMISSSSGRGRSDITEIAKHFYSAKLKSDWEGVESKTRL